jgi:hypothetical protein
MWAEKGGISINPHSSEQPVGSFPQKGINLVFVRCLLYCELEVRLAWEAEVLDISSIESVQLLENWQKKEA